MAFEDPTFGDRSPAHAPRAREFAIVWPEILRIEAVRQRSIVGYTWGMGSARILVVDDDPKFLHFLSELLIGAGYDVHCTGEPLRTVEMAEVLGPDLVILDISMPGKDGFQLARDLRANRKTKSARIMFLTGHPVPTNPEKVKELKGIAYLRKPFQSTNLIRILKTLLPRSLPTRSKPF